jgi:hypothetical protein
MRGAGAAVAVLGALSLAAAPTVCVRAFRLAETRS